MPRPDDTHIPSARVTPTAVFFDNVKLPGVIAEGGVTIKPGGMNGVNILTVDFIVDTIGVEGNLSGANDT